MRTASEILLRPRDNMSLAPQPLQPDADERLPSQSIRTALSLFLFAHFFMLGVSLFGRVPFASELGRRLAAVPLFAAYRQALDMNRAYMFPLTRTEEIDVNHVLEATIRMPDGATEEIVFPNPADAAGERARHWRMLARHMSALVGNSDYEEVLPSGVGGGLIDRYGAKDVTLRLRGHLLQDRFGSERGDDPNRADLWRDRYQARVWRSGDQIYLMKQEGRGEAAPVADPSAFPRPLIGPQAP
jgi:hypothetical protein